MAAKVAPWLVGAFARVGPDERLPEPPKGCLRVVQVGHGGSSAVPLGLGRGERQSRCLLASAWPLEIRRGSPRHRIVSTPSAKSKGRSPSASAPRVAGVTWAVNAEGFKVYPLAGSGGRNRPG
jgi:hypothetical protein